MLIAKWLLAIIAAALGFSSVSVLVALRRLYFLAAGLSHAALLAAVASIPLYVYAGGSPELWSLILMIPLVLVFDVFERQGIDPQVASAVYVSFTASASVIVMYYVLTNYPYTANLWAYILGDPLLASWHTVTTAIIIAAIVTILTILTFREHLCMGIDRDTVRLAGLHVKVYEYSLLVALAIAVVGLLRLVGFVLAHVYLLLPGAIAITAARRAAYIIPIALGVALAAGIIGLVVSVTVNLAPSGVIGLLMLAAYSVALALRRS